MVVTEPDAEPHKRASMILVPTDTPGYEIVRRIPVMGHEGRGWGTHCETRFTGVRVPLANTLGEPGDGFRIAQKRLGPGRIHHVMRWLGQMQRAFELMCTYALEREAHGGPLAEKQTVQNWIAESAAEIQACRLMTLQAAQRIDEGDEARVEVSLIKFYAARVLQDVVDRAIQVHGGLGMTDDTPLALMWRMARGGRIYDGPDEVHKAVVARRILQVVRRGRRMALHVALEGRHVRLEPLVDHATRRSSGRSRRIRAPGAGCGCAADESREAFHAWFASIEMGFAHYFDGAPRRPHELPQPPCRTTAPSRSATRGSTRRRGGRARTPRRSTSS